MSSLRFVPLEIPRAHWKDSCLPSLFPLSNVQIEKTLELDEDDEVFWDVGKISTLLPYSMQSLYDRNRQVCEMEAAVLENERLKAVFLPELGGRLWSLTDKTSGRELLYVNDCIQPCNLALRNAWVSGGVEWNPGMIGHGPYTCSRIGTARLHTEAYGEVLRFYAFERIREIVYQMDFMLPEGSPVLLARMRIKNPHSRTIPMYWFSNMAVPQTPGCRVFVNAREAYHSGVGHVGKTAIPVGREGLDWSNPYSSRPAADFFYKLTDRQRKYIACYDKDGHGLFQTSTSRQKGRKLFVWGQNNGAASWQKWLTDTAGEYMEIQAGVNRTQYECIPMPPNAAWEWVEAYGAAELTPEIVHGDFRAACTATERLIEDAVGEDWLETFLIKTKQEVALRPADEVVGTGVDGGWAVLENLRRKKAGEPVLEPHLDFGRLETAQEPWYGLLENGVLLPPAVGPYSYLTSAPWVSLLEGSLRQGRGENWYACYHRGVMAFAEEDMPLALHWFNRSRELKETPWNVYGLAMSYFTLGDERCLEHMRTALEGLPDQVELGREYMKLLLRFERYEEAERSFEGMTPPLKEDGFIRYGVAFSLARLGKCGEAEKFLYDRGGLVIPDLREEENHLADLWHAIEEAKAAKEGRIFDPQKAPVPARLDFSMTDVVRQ